MDEGRGREGEGTIPVGFPEAPEFVVHGREDPEGWPQTREAAVFHWVKLKEREGAVPGDVAHDGP